MKKTDTIRPDKKHTLEITGTKGLESVLGKEKKSFETLYVYIGKKTIEEYSTAKWYYYYQKSWNGRGRGKLHYKRNDVMKSAAVGDLLVVARKPNDDLLMLVIKDGNDAKDAVLAHIGVQQEKPKDETSFWSKLWGSSSEPKTEEYDIELAALPMPPVSEKSWIRIYFTPGTDCEDNIVAEIEKAKKIDIAVYSITNRKIVDAILAAHKRGAVVRVITDRAMAGNKYSLDEELAAAGIPVVIHKKHKIMHNKYAIVDGKTIVTGSYNWTKNATQSNSENCLFFQQPNKEYSVHFEKLWDLYADAVHSVPQQGEGFYTQVFCQLILGE
ncbi:MAG: phospholipase D family protein [Alphaproteobacteria bacterium]|nr:phospholipase D family protein [Alphaproteobacteria bacterium]